MKPFNLKEHLEHPDWEVVTREGRPVRIVYTELDDSVYPVVAVINNWHAQKFTAGGLFHAGKKMKYDLFFASERHEGWVNVFKGASGNTCVGDSRIFKSEEDAKKGALTWKTYIGTAKIEWEE